MKLSALVVTCNEANVLEDCLRSLSGISQLIVVDLESSDGSAEIARKFTQQVYSHPKVPAVELAIPDILHLIENEWFLRADPDEVLPDGLIDGIFQSIENHPDAAIIEIPFEYYFLRRPLKTTAWGGIRHFPKVLNKNRIAVHKWVHAGISPEEGFTVFQLPFNGHNAVRHYWIDSLEALREKHERYLRLEGKSRHERGERFSWLKMAYKSARYFLYSFLKMKGILGGRDGWFLSFFFAQYEARAWLSLRDFERRLEETPAHD